MKNLREQLIQKIQETPDDVLQEVFDFLMFIVNRRHLATQKPDNPYPLRGVPIEYIDPTEPVALEDWDALS